MGAELIGYLVKGPATFDEAAIAMAVKVLQERNAKIEDYLKRYRAVGGDDAVDLDRALILGADEFMEGLLDDIGNREGEVCESLLEDELIADPDKKIADFIDGWNGDFRDMNSRTDPDDPTQLLVFAGEMSWGEGPSGRGYELLEDADKNGVLAALGIR